jgi:ABC-type transport system substrate-binding protein
MYIHPVEASPGFKLLHGGFMSYEVGYYFNPTNAPLGARETIKRAAELWNNVNCSCFTLTELGETSLTPGVDYVNVVCFGSLDGKGGGLGWAYVEEMGRKNLTAYFDYEGTHYWKQLDVDIKFDVAESWDVERPCASGYVDLLTAALHEFGHLAGLNHCNKGEYEVMMEEIDYGWMIDLQPGDMDGVRKLYPSSLSNEVQLGPRAPGLAMSYCADLASGYSDLKYNVIDLLLWPLSQAQYNDAIADPNILLCRVSKSDRIGFDLNSNYTLSSNPTLANIRNPLSLKEFRQALAHMIDKNYIVSTLCAGFAERIDVPVPATQKGWWNTSVTGANYPYPYNLATAAAKLNAAGFTDTDDSDTIRNYPAGWPGAPGRPNIHPFIFYARTDSSEMMLAAQYLRDNMVNVLGLPVDFRTGNEQYCYPNVMYKREYHIYIGDYDADRYPMHLYTFYHDMFFFPQGSNHVTGTNAYNAPNYPLLNTYLDDFWYAPSIDTAVSRAKRVQGFIVDNCITIELWSTKSFYAYRNLLGVTGMNGAGAYNVYTLMNAYRSDNQKALIRIGTKLPMRLNQIYSSWSSESQIMAAFMDGTFEANPYDILTEQPWRARDWLVSTWWDGTVEKTQVTWWYYPEIYWIEPRTGLKFKKFTAEDVEFSIWYYYQTPDSWIYPCYKDIHSVIRHDDYKVTIRFNAKSVWFQWAGLARQLPKAKGWLEAPLTTVETRTFVVGTNATTPGDLPLPHAAVGAPVDIISCSVPAQIQQGSIYIPNGHPSGTVITVTYRARGNAAGYVPGGLLWNATLIGTGPYYLREFVPGLGGFAKFNANCNHFMTTPLLGEIDWHYEWSGTAPATPADPPRGGYWQIKLYDIGKVSAAYGSQGRYIPDVHWMTGADIAISSDGKPGKIDIFDVSTVTGRYNQISMRYNP